MSRRYGHVDAVHGLNLRVFRHCVTGFPGRNGAGKSTTIRMLLGRAIGDASENRESRRHVAYVGEYKELHGHMTVEQMIRFTASFHED